MAKKKVKQKPYDGLGPKDIKRLVAAIRRVWGWNYARRICLERATGKDGFPKCELCKKKVPKVFPDHIKPVGEFVASSYIEKMFVTSKELQAICKKCHQLKTNIERSKMRKEKEKSDLGF
jgi:hypothetical protein